MCARKLWGKILCWFSIIIHSITFFSSAVCMSDWKSSEFPRLAFRCSLLLLAEVISQVSESHSFPPHAIICELFFFQSQIGFLSPNLYNLFAEASFFPNDKNKALVHDLISSCRPLSRIVPRNLIFTKKGERSTAYHSFYTHNEK